MILEKQKKKTNQIKCHFENSVIVVITKTLLNRTRLDHELPVNI